MSILNGGSGRRDIAEMSDRDYIIEVFLPSITPAEAARLSLMSEFTRIPQLVDAVVKMRQAR